MQKVEIGNNILYCGDCREILRDLDEVNAVITDPPWDQAKGIPGAEDPRGLFADASERFAHNCDRAVIQLGCYTDPGFLAPLTTLMPFCQVLWLEYPIPSFRGRVLVNADVAYAFGKHIECKPGARVISSRYRSSGRENTESIRNHGRNRSKRIAKETMEQMPHPMPRHLKHVRWLVQWWSEETDIVCDPFMGSGTTGVACAQLGRKFIGIEIDEQYFDYACERIDAQRQSIISL